MGLLVGQLQAPKIQDQQDRSRSTGSTWSSGFPRNGNRGCGLGPHTWQHSKQHKPNSLARDDLCSNQPVRVDTVDAYAGFDESFALVAAVASQATAQTIESEAQTDADPRVAAVNETKPGTSNA